MRRGLPAMKVGPAGEIVTVPMALPPGENCRLEYRGCSWSAVNAGMGVIAVVVVIVLAKTDTVVPQQSAFVIENLGKYSRTLQAGFHILIPFVERGGPPAHPPEKKKHYREKEI